MSHKTYAFGNWKMNGLMPNLPIIQEIAQVAKDVSCASGLCLPATMVHAARDTLSLGGQDCHTNDTGAHTGDISAPMLADSGAEMVIVGYSERRADHSETDELVAVKAKVGWAAGLTVILCIGETEDQYRSGQTLNVLASQIAGALPEGATPDNTIIAYEPVLATGTGLTPGTDEIAKTHTFIRSTLPNADLSILYGGSVSADNARDIFALVDVDGGLVGGASLTAETFIPISKAQEATT